MSSRGTPCGLSFPRLRRGPLPLTGPRTATPLSLHHPPLRFRNALAARSTLTILQDSQRPVSSIRLLIETANEKPA